MSSQEIQFDLELNKDIMSTIIDNYKSTYVMNKMYNTPEYNKMMINADHNIQNEFTSLNNLYNDVLKKIDNQQSIIQEKIKVLNDVKTRYNNLKKTTTDLNGLSNASKTRYSDTKTQFTYQIITMVVQTTAILAVCYLFYSTYRQGKNTGVNNLLKEAKKVIKPITNKIYKPVRNTNIQKPINNILARGNDLIGKSDKRVVIKNPVTNPVINPATNAVTNPAINPATNAVTNPATNPAPRPVLRSIPTL